MRNITRVFIWLCALTAMAGTNAWGVPPTLAIDEECPELAPLYNALPTNETYVTSMVARPADDAIIGTACGKKRICLFRFDAETSQVTLLDAFEGPYWDEPRVALAPNGEIFLGARLTYDKPFVFERLRERPHTLGAFMRRDSKRPAELANEEAEGMPIRRYSPDGAPLDAIPLPENLVRDGVGALAITADGTTLCALSSPGGHLFTVDLATGEGAEHGEVVPFPQHHQTRPLSRAFMVTDDMVYVCGATESAHDDDTKGFILALDPATGTLDNLGIQLPAVKGRRRFAALDAAVRLEDGSFLGGTSDGYLFRFDPASATIEGFGKPLRQHGIRGLALSPDGWVYGVGGEPLGLPRLFAFDPERRELRLGTGVTGRSTSEESSNLGECGAIAITSDGTLVCGERERRGYLLVYRPKDTRYTWKRTVARDEFAHCTRDRFVATSDTSGAQLAPTYLISDAMARSSKISEPLSDMAFAKKTFYLRGPCRETEILFYHGGGDEKNPMLIRVNSHDIRHVQDKDRMLTGGWDREIISGEYLQQGKNEIVFGRAGSLLVDTDAPGGNSAKSAYWYGPWSDDTLGPDNNLRGEYVVHVRVHGYPTKGVMTSPVMDIATFVNRDAAQAVPPLIQVTRLRARAEAMTPPGTSVHLELRTGPSPDYDPATWTDWQREPLVAANGPMHRFAQWRAVLRSSSASATPVLSRVLIEAGGTASSPNASTVHITKAPDNDLAVSSYAFDYADPHHARMRHLREKYQLEEVVAAGTTESEKLALLRHWVRSQWEGWDPGKYNYCPQWNALEILELAPARLGLGMCTHYATVFTQCAGALGYHARHLIVDHHCLAEVWSNEHGKWILQDPGLLPNRVVAFQYEADGVPINALEMHQRSLAGNADDVTFVPDPPVPVDEMRDKMVRLFRRFAIPLRNDHLYRAEPQELEHGNAQYHWDGYLWWTDDLNPKYPEYSLLTNRPEDFYWDLNKTAITVQDSGTAGVVTVNLSGLVPDFERFMIRADESEWHEAAAAFGWTLKPGINVLETKAVNTMGIEGPVNRIEMEYAPK